FIREKCSIEIEDSNIHILCDNFILPVFFKDGQELVLVDDLIPLANAIVAMSNKDKTRFINGLLFDREVVTPCDSIRIDLSIEDNDVEYVVYSALRNLIAHAQRFEETDMETSSFRYFSSTRISTGSKRAAEYIEEQISRANKADISQTSQFTRSAHYMGTKRYLSGFIIEAISNFLPNNGIILDIMCGSGVMS